MTSWDPPSLRTIRTWRSATREGVDIGTDVLIDIQNANGGAGNDTIIGNVNANIISGAGGNDTIDAGAGNDTILYTVGDGVDIIDGGDDTTDTLAVSGTAGDDIIDVVLDVLASSPRSRA